VRKQSLFLATVLVLMTVYNLLVTGPYRYTPQPLDNRPQTPAKHVNPLRPIVPRGQFAAHVPGIGGWRLAATASGVAASS
jgi:hypothetical protein